MRLIEYLRMTGVTRVNYCRQDQRREYSPGQPFDDYGNIIAPPDFCVLRYASHGLDPKGRSSSGGDQVVDGEDQGFAREAVAVKPCNAASHV
jgi:hypothetical protein